MCARFFFAPARVCCIRTCVMDVLPRWRQRGLAFAFRPSGFNSSNRLSCFFSERTYCVSSEWVLYVTRRLDAQALGRGFYRKATLGVFTYDVSDPLSLVNTKRCVCEYECMYLCACCYTAMGRGHLRAQPLNTLFVVFDS